MVMLSKLRRTIIFNHQGLYCDPFYLQLRAKAHTTAPHKTPYKKEVFKNPKRGSVEFQQMLQQQKEYKKEIQGKTLDDTLTPRFVSAMIFGAAVPQSMLIYPMIWNDACSDAFFMSLEISLSWIAILNALEGAAACGLGYIDYKTKVNNDPQLVYAMRKKRLAFTKFAFIMAVVAMFFIDKPTPNCVFPLIVSSVWNAMKLGTQIGYNLTPEKFFYARTFLSIYNLIFLVAIWYKLRQARKDKLDLEFTFYQRVEGIMLSLSNIFSDQEFGQNFKKEVAQQ